MEILCINRADAAAYERLQAIIAGADVRPGAKPLNPAPRQYKCQ